MPPGIGVRQPRGDVFEVIRCLQCGLNVLGSLNACFSKCFRRELKKPAVVHVNGFCDVFLPEIGFVQIDRHNFLFYGLLACTAEK